MKTKAIVIFGKRQGRRAENKQLIGRTAMAAALWLCASHPKPYIIFVAADVYGPQLTPDTQRVKQILETNFAIPANYILLRQYSNCTVIEVRAVRVLKRIYQLGHIIAISHAYHTPRVQVYLQEVLTDVSVTAAHPRTLTQLTILPEQVDVFRQIEALLIDSQPGPLDLAREQIVEWILFYLHHLDQRGRIERILANWLRPETRQTKK